MATALPNKENVTEDSTRSFFINFDNAISCAQDKLNATIRELVQATKLESHKVESYKEEHPVTLDTVFSPGNQATEFTKSTSVNQQMRLVLLGSDDSEESTREKKVDNYREKNSKYC